MHLPRREIPILTGGFAGGLLIAFGLVFIWVLITSGSEEGLALNAPADPHTARNDSTGLIGYTYHSISNRLNAERREVHPSRGDLSFRATRIVWKDARNPDFASVGELRGVINASSAQAGNIIVRAAVISNAEVYVEQEQAGGEWNYQRVLDRMKTEDDGGPKSLFVVNDLAVRNTRVRVNTPDQDFVIENLAAQMPRVELSGPDLPEPRVQVARMTGILAMNGERRPIAATNAALRFPEGGARFEIAEVSTGQTRVTNLAGEFGGMPGIGVRATGRVDNMRFEDVRFISPRLPASGVASFTFAVQPLSETRTEIVLSGGSVQTEGSNIRGSATIIYGGGKTDVREVDARFDPLNLALIEQLTGDTLPYNGTITGTARGSNGLINFDVNTRLTSADTRTPLVTHVTGSAFFSDAGFELRRLEADMRDVSLVALRAVLPGLPLSGTISGRVSLTGSPDKSPLNLNVRLELALGVAIVEGTVDLRGVEPAYNLTGRLLAVNLDQLLEPNAPPVFMSATFTVNGRGSKPETMDARLHLAGRFSGWRTTPRDSIHVDALLRSGSITIDTAAMKLATMTASARGTWYFTGAGSGGIGYAVNLDPITPFGPYFPAIADEDASGSLRTTGMVSGARGRIVLTGDASGSRLAIGDWAAGAIESKYRFVVGPAVPEIQFNASARDLTTPTAGAYTTATAQLNLLSPVFGLEVKAERSGAAGGLEIVADGRIPPTGPREVILQRGRLEFGSEQWALLAPARIAWSSERNAPVTITNLDFREVNGDGRIHIDGRIRPPASADFKVTAVSVPIGDVQRLIGMQPRVQGELSSDLAITVTSGVPQVIGKFALAGASIEGVKISAFSGDIDYRNDKLITNATAVVDTAGSMQFHAELPLDMRFGDSTVIRMRDTGPVRITMVSDSIAVAPFGALLREVEDLRGRLTANVTVTGTVQSPLLAGTLALHNGAMHVIPANQTYDSINAVLTLENQRAVIQQLVARSDGTITASGAIEFRDLNRPILNVTANLNGFRAARVEAQEPARVDGQAQVTGPFDAAVLTGNVELSDGYFPVPTVFSSPLDDELELLAEPGAAEKTSNRPRASSFVENLRIDNFHLRAGESLWFAMPDARAELEGELVVDKQGDDMRITGELHGTRGQYTLRAGPIVRRFDVVEASIRFLGDTEINPVINITASREIIDPTGGTMDIRVIVRGTMRSPTLALASGNAANIPQSELLSILLFGRAQVGLAGGGAIPGQAIVTETFVGGLGELLSMELEDELIDAGVSLDIFQLRFGNSIANLYQPSIVIGEEVGNNLFITVESGLGSLFNGDQGSIIPTLRLEWRMNPTTRMSLAYEPVYPWRALRGITVAQPLLNTQQNRQWKFDIKKRWSW